MAAEAALELLKSVMGASAAFLDVSTASSVSGAAGQLAVGTSSPSASGPGRSTASVSVSDLAFETHKRKMLQNSLPYALPDVDLYSTLAARPMSTAGQRLRQIHDKPYDQHDIDSAVCFVRAQQMTIPFASFIFKVPESTLRDHIKLAEAGSAARSVGHPRQLSDADELGIVAWTQLRSLLRFPLSKDEVMASAACIAKIRGNPFVNAAGEEMERPSEHWWSAFKRRHNGQIRVSRGSRLKAKQAELTRKDLDDTYDLVQELCTKYNISAADVWNFDEVGFDKAVGEKEQLVGSVNQDRVQFFTKFSGHVTVGTAISAAGERLDPFFLFKGSPNSSHEKDAIELMLAGLGSFRPGIAWTPKGWITRESFELFIQFFANATKAGVDGKWVLLIVDGHDSRFNSNMWQYCADNNILLLTLPPHSTSVLQPVDVGPNVRFKYWLKRLHDRENRALAVGVHQPDLSHLDDLEPEERNLAVQILRQKSMGAVDRSNIVQRILFPAWRLAFTKSNILRGWRETGFFPPDRSKVKPSAIVPKTNAEAKAMMPEETRTLHVSADVQQFLPLPTDEQLAEFHTNLQKGKGGRGGRKKQKGPRLLLPEGEQKVAAEYKEKQDAKEQKAIQREEKKRAREQKKREKEKAAKERAEKKAQKNKEKEEKKRKPHAKGKQRKPSSKDKPRSSSKAKRAKAKQIGAADTAAEAAAANGDELDSKHGQAQPAAPGKPTRRLVRLRDLHKLNRSKRVLSSDDESSDDEPMDDAVASNSAAAGTMDSEPVAPGGRPAERPATPASSALGKRSRSDVGEASDRPLKRAMSRDPNDDECLVCGKDGELICWFDRLFVVSMSVRACSEWCPNAFHAACLDMKDVPEGDYYCDMCLGKKDQPMISQSDLIKDSFVVLNGRVNDRGVKRLFLMARIDNVSPLRVHWLAPVDPKAYLTCAWNPIMVNGEPHVDVAELGSVLMLPELKSQSDSSQSVRLTDDVIDFLKRRKLC